MIYIPKHTYHRWHQFMCNRYWWQRGQTSTPQGRTIPANMMNVSVWPPVCAIRRLAHCGVVAKGYLRRRDGVSCKTSSQMWDGWYFSRLMLRDELLTWMNIASLMVLVTLCDSLPTMEKQSTLIGCPVDWQCWQMGEGALKCSLSLSPKVLPDSLMYSSSPPVWVHAKWYIMPLLWVVVF